MHNSTSECTILSLLYSNLQDLEIIINNFIYICDSIARDLFLGILYGYKMALQIIALLFAFSIRKVKVKGLDDAKYIGAAIYVTSIVLAMIIVATYSLKDVINGFAALFCTGFLVGTTVILLLVFVPLVCQATLSCCSYSPMKVIPLYILIPRALGLLHHRDVLSINC